jgi:NADPH:quinone reductase-like Zn-dependent oxidoreductase
MKAAVYLKYGSADVIQLTEIAKPIPNENQVLVRVHASTVNRTDTGFRSAEYFISRFWTGLFRPKYPVLGNEFAGVVEAVGKQVKHFSRGDSVFGFNDKQCGGHAEYLVIDENAAIAHMPVQYPFERAAALTEGIHYALCDIKAAGVRENDFVLVYGATGAIGSAAVQLLKSMGVNVTAVCAGKYMDLVKTLGADVVVDYETQDYSQSNQRYDLVLDAVGKTSFKNAKPVLKEKGIYISTELGKNGQNVFYALLGKFSAGKKVMFPIPSICQDDVIYFSKLAQTGKFRPLIDKLYTLDQIKEAHRYVESGQKIGNVVIKIVNESDLGV